MMILFLTGTLLVLLVVLYLQLRWVRNNSSPWIYRIVGCWSFLCVGSLICRFNSLFYQLEQGALRSMVLLLSTLALLWIALFSIVGGILYGYQHIAHKRIAVRFVLLFVALCTLLLTFGGYAQARNLQSTRYTIKLKKQLKEDVHMALISDLHLGSGFDHNQMKVLFQRIHEQNVDVLVISGDLFDEATPLSAIEEFCELSKKANLPHGMYYVSGNHELLQKQEKMYEDTLAESGYQILSDQVVLVEDAYYIAGRLDKNQERKELFDIIKDVNAQKPLLVLDHRPDYDVAGKNRIDLQLSGHTHHGQIFPNTLLTKIAYPYDYGYYRDPYPMVVSSGAGTWGIPIRVGSSSEVVFLTLTS